MRLAQDPTAENRSIQSGTLTEGAVCRPIHMGSGQMNGMYLKPLSKVRNPSELITGSRAIICGEINGEPCTQIETSDGRLIGGSSAMIASHFMLASAENDPGKIPPDQGNDDPSKEDAGTPRPMSNAENKQMNDEKVQKPGESGERVIEGASDYTEGVAVSRAGMEKALMVDERQLVTESGVLSSVKPSAGSIKIYETLPPPLESKGNAEIQLAMLEKLSKLHRLNTLEAHEELLRELKQLGVYSAQRWEDIHSNPRLRHNLSSIGEHRVNPFAKLLARRLSLDEESVILELGSGFGNDAVYFAENTGAHVIGVDSSQEAITKAQFNIGEKGMRNRVNLTCHDFIEVLEQSKGMNLDMIYSISTLHYFPPLVLQQRIFPMIADALRANQPGGEHGKLCFAMKIASSASAQSANQHKLVPEDPYNPSFDERDVLVRWYPDNKKSVISLAENAFNITYAQVVPVRGYDRKGDTEIFCYVMAEPKDHPEAA